MKRVYAFIMLIGIIINAPVCKVMAYTPKLMVSAYSIDVNEVMAGDEFELTLTLSNTANIKLKNIKIIVSSSGGEILPAEGTGSIYVDNISANSDTNLSIGMYAISGLDEKAYGLNVKMEYEDGYGNPYVMEDNIYIPIYQKQRISVTDIMSDGVKVGDDVEVTAQVNNLGEGSLYNVSVKIKGANVENQESYIGNIESGKSGNIDIITKTTNVTDIEATTCHNKLIVSYEDKQGNANTESYDVYLSIDATNYENLEILKEETEKTKPDSKIIVMVAVCVMAAVLLGWNIVKRRRKKNLLEEI